MRQLPRRGIVPGDLCVTSPLSLHSRRMVINKRMDYDVWV